MPPRRDFRAKKRVTVMQFKGGKAVKKSKRSVPLRHAAQQASTSALPLVSRSGEVEVEGNCIGDTDDVHETEETTVRKSRKKATGLP